MRTSSMGIEASHRSILGLKFGQAARPKPLDEDALAVILGGFFIGSFQLDHFGSSFLLSALILFIDMSTSLWSENRSWSTQS
jgi:hypothetical protein